ncbi:GNAT acetyltransferase-like protein [Anaerobacterium chartisolvens]|uniref:GNAT acetyltransferase-like protein n=1 Tax=Anaerobacterium chartisolvens TaxID=1297424 RepID=A0A369B9K5_9FIRM|nr:GNAT family N-acetyltransferase [Anaerobacterium chartisolvens]RCX16364.1 GNAT acetyltransferase-like protein [Anaerobacterium chartisolvens]
MSVYSIKNKNVISPLFDGWQETFIWSCLQDCMGEAYADDLNKPSSAQIIVGDFCVLAGSANHEILRNRPENRQSEFIIMVPQSKHWEEAIELVFQGKAFRCTRYATKKDKTAFDKSALQKIVSQLPGEYELRMIDKALYEQSLALQWSKDLCGNYPTYEDYRLNGMGTAILKDGELVSGASSYSFYKGGIEIEIDTREDERRKGLALVCGAKLILECLERGLYPSWDAHNKGSLALAERLGYELDREYPAYEITGF